jgi:hypothetical protein
MQATTPLRQPAAAATSPSRGGSNSMLNVRDLFPAIVGWHFLVSAATAQKP